MAYFGQYPKMTCRRPNSKITVACFDLCDTCHSVITLPPGIGPLTSTAHRATARQQGDAGMMMLAKIVYWLMSILAALLLAWTAVLLVSIAYGQEMPDRWLHALSLALLAICVWFAGWVFRYFVQRLWGSTTAPSIVEAASAGGLFHCAHFSKSLCAWRASARASVAACFRPPWGLVRFWSGLI